MKIEQISMDSEGLRIISGEVKNFQGVSNKIFHVEGSSFFIIGKNQSNKSCFMRAIQSPIDSSSIPSKVIKDGEEECVVKLKVGGSIDGEKKEYNFKIKFSEKDQRGKVSVIDGDGNTLENRTAQKNLLNFVSFEVDEFIRKGLTETGQVSKPGLLQQIEILKSFMTQEDKVKLFELEKEYDRIYKERTSLNTEIDNIKASAKVLSYTQEELAVYSADKNSEITEVQKKQQDIANSIVEWSKQNNDLENKRSRIAKIEKDTADLPKAIIALNKLKPICDIDLQVEDGTSLSVMFGEIIRQVKLLEVDVKHMESKGKENNALIQEVSNISIWMQSNPKPSVDDLNTKMTELLSHQEKYREIKSVEVKGIELKAKTEKSDDITKRLEGIKLEKKELFSQSKLPVKNLSFDSEGIYYNEKPFNEDHCNSADIIAVGVKIAMAMNPTLRVVMIKHGSLIDKPTLKKMVKFCHDSNYQVIGEIVDFEGTKETEVVFAEEFLK